MIAAGNEELQYSSDARFQKRARESERERERERREREREQRLLCTTCTQKKAIK